jgi:peroxiredoxin
MNSTRLLKQIVFATLLLTLLFAACTKRETPKSQAAPPLEEYPVTMQERLERVRGRLDSKISPEMKKTYGDFIKKMKGKKIEAKALQVGDRAPDFTLTNTRGKRVALSTLLKKGPVVLFWYRGNWCPYCDAYLQAFSENLPSIYELGASILALSPELSEKAVVTRKENHVWYSILHDKNNQVARQYKLVYKLPDEILTGFKDIINLEENNGTTSNELPITATYVVDQNRTIQYAFVDFDHTKRADPNDVIKKLQEIK